MMDAELIVTLAGIGVSTLIGSGTLGTLIFVAYKAGNWKGEVTTTLTNIRGDLNGPMAQQFKDLKEDSHETRKLAQKTMDHVASMDTRCVQHAERIQRLEDLSE